MRIGRNVVVTIINLAATLWLGVEFFGFFTEFSYIVKNDISTFELTFPLLPFIAFLVVGLVFTPLLLKNKNQSVAHIYKSNEVPHDLQGDDERNEQIIGNASRKAYAAMWQISAAAILFMIFYPLISDIIPYYPILVIALIPLVSSFVYFKNIKKYY